MSWLGAETHKADSTAKALEACVMDFLKGMHESHMMDCTTRLCSGRDSQGRWLQSRQHQRPARPASLRIYEAHVGMSSEKQEVATYQYFTGTFLLE